MLLFVLILAGVAGYFAAREAKIGPFAPPPWWVRSWRPAEGGPTPQLDLDRSADGVVGQLVLPFDKTGQFHRSMAVLAGESRGDLLLLVCEGEHPSSEVLYALRQTAPGRASFYRIVSPGRGAVRLQRPSGPSSPYAVPILYPADDLGKHILVAEMLAASGGRS